MSLLNSEAIKVVLIQPDILSEQGTLQSIWDMFTANVDYKKDTNTILKVILKYTDGNVIRHMLFGDEDCLTRINQYHNMVKDVQKLGVSRNNLTNFMYALDKSLSEYVSIKDNSDTNIQINMGGNFEDPSYRDQALILSAMLKNGLINSDEVQSLLDDQNLGLLTAANSCISVCRGGESPSTDRGCGIRTTSELTLNDFGTRTEELIDCIKNLITTDVDLFPNSPSELGQMIFPVDKFDVHSIFRQGTYIPNLANYGILSATSQYIQDSFDLDNETAIYELSSLMDRLKGFMNYFNKSICLLSYMVAGSMIIRYLKTRPTGVSNDPDMVSKIYTLKQNIANAYSMFMKVDEAEPSKISDMVRIPAELEDFVKTAGCELSADSLFSDDEDNVFSDVKAALNDILSGIEEIGATLEEGYGIKVSDDTTVAASDTPSALSSLMESSGIEQARENDSQTFARTVSEAATKFHSELNRSLLERNFENAANQIALEVALLEQIDNRLINSLEVKTVAESIQRDILTYREKIDASSTGVSTYQDSANSYVSSLFG